MLVGSDQADPVPAHVRHGAGTGGTARGAPLVSEIVNKQPGVQAADAKIAEASDEWNRYMSLVRELATEHEGALAAPRLR